MHVEFCETNILGPVHECSRHQICDKNTLQAPITDFLPEGDRTIGESNPKYQTAVKGYSVFILQPANSVFLSYLYVGDA